MFDLFLDFILVNISNQDNIKNFNDLQKNWKEKKEIILSR